MAREAEVTLEPSTITRIVEGIYRRQAAYSTYGYWLLQRLDGYSDGVSLLALWREIAYEPAGSPIQNFKLKYEDFVSAEKTLVAFLNLEHRNA